MLVSMSRITFLLLAIFACLIATVSAYPRDSEPSLPDPTSIRQIQDYLEQVERENGTYHALEKRGVIQKCFASLCCFGKTDPDDPSSTEMGYLCRNGYPSVADLKQKIQAYGNVGRQVSLFYTGLGGGQGQQKAGQWATCHKDLIPDPPGFVTWDNIVEVDWYNAQAAAIVNQGLSSQVLGRVISQAFAEASVGDVYIFAPAGLNNLKDLGSSYPYPTAWIGWEYPALTRNPAVTNIWRVDPSDTDNQRTLFWTQSYGPSPEAPIGIRAPPPPS